MRFGHGQKLGDEAPAPGGRLDQLGAGPQPAHQRQRERRIVLAVRHLDPAVAQLGERGGAVVPVAAQPPRLLGGHADPHRGFLAPALHRAGEPAAAEQLADVERLGRSGQVGTRLDRAHAVGAPQPRPAPRPSEVDPDQVPAAPVPEQAERLGVERVLGVAVRRAVAQRDAAAIEEGAQERLGGRAVVP